MEKLGRYFIRASFSRERMTYFPEESKVIYESKACPRRRARHIRSSYVFSKPDGKRYVEIKGAFQRALKATGIEDFRFHDLRHTFASSLVQRGVDLYQVQRLLGHKDGRMTQRYAHLSPENVRDAILKLDISQEHKKNLSQF